MKTFLPFLLGLGLLAGCASQPAALLPEEGVKYSLENTEKFQLLDRPAQLAVACTGLQEHLDAAGRLEVVANLKNRGPVAGLVEVRCVFQDAAGRPSGEETPWQELRLGAEDTEAVHYSATTGLARRFTIQVRSAR